MINKRYLRCLFFSLLMVTGVVQARVNLLMPYDTLIRPDFIPNSRFQIDAFAEVGLGAAQAYGDAAPVNNVLQIWNCDQNALAMLDGFPEGCERNDLRSALGPDDGVRGHFCVKGDLDMKFSGALAAHYYLMPHLTLSAYIPFYSLSLNKVCWQDQTKDLTSDDIMVKELLTNDFEKNVKDLGECLSLKGWKRKGVGDLTVFLQCFKEYYQHRSMLKKAQLNGRLGFAFPTGLKQDDDKLFATPFGNDGAVGLIAGAGIDVMLGYYFKTGFDIQLKHLFSNTRDRRIKTAANQTELLLLEKSCVQKDFGLTQRFNLYFQMFHIIKGLSLKVGYQFLKHGDDAVTVVNNDYSSSTANTAEHLEEWMMHHVVVDLGYDFYVHRDETAKFKPYIGLFARIPFKGTKVALINTLGIVVSAAF